MSKKTTNWKSRIGEFKVRWWERYFTYLAKPMTVYNFLMISFVSVVVGMPVWVIGVLVLGLVGLTVVVAKKDMTILRQEQRFTAENNPILMEMMSDIKEIKNKQAR